MHSFTCIYELLFEGRKRHRKIGSQIMKPIRPLYFIFFEKKERERERPSQQQQQQENEIIISSLLCMEIEDY
jgi:hypothetical protein